MCGRDNHSPAIVAATPIMPRGCQQEDLQTADASGRRQTERVELGQQTLGAVMGAAGSEGWHPVPIVRKPRGEGGQATAGGSTNATG